MKGTKPKINLATSIDNLSLGMAVETFLYMGLAGKSKQTVHWYRDRLRVLTGELGENRLLVSLLEVDLQKFLADLAHRNTRYGGASTRPEEAGELSPYTLQGYARAIRRFCRWLHQQGWTVVNLAKDISLPKVPKTGRKGIAEKDLAAILHSASANVRDYAILRFVESTGCRLGGVVNLRLDDLNLIEKDPRIARRVTVREKGDKERTVFLHDEALRALLAWLVERPKIEDDHIFLAQSPGQPWHPIKERGVYEIFKKYARAAGVRRNFSPHQWRHRFARRMAQSGMPLGILSQIMGHSSVQVTVEFYNQFVVDQLQRSYDQYNDRSIAEDFNAPALEQGSK